VGAKAREVERYKLWYSGSIKGRNGVGILVVEELVDFVVKIRRKSDRIIAIKVGMRSEIINMFSVYTPQIGLPDDMKKQFWEDLDLVIQYVARTEKLFIGGDLNGHIIVEAGGYDMIHGGFDYRERNNGGVSVLDFAVAYKLLVVNFFFKKKEDHLVTFKSGALKTQIDYFLTRADNRRLCKDCEVIPNEYLGTQHRLLVLDVELNYSKWKKRSVGKPRVKW